MTPRKNCQCERDEDGDFVICDNCLNDQDIKVEVETLKEFIER